jgi:lipid A ethanolaminephosphotransferase
LSCQVAAKSPVVPPKTQWFGRTPRPDGIYFSFLTPQSRRTYIPAQNRTIASGVCGGVKIGIGHAITFAKAAVVAALFAATAWSPVLDRLNYFATMERYLSGGYFVLVTTACLLGFAVIPFLRWAWIRVPLVLVTIGGFALGQMFHAVSGDIISPDQVTMLWREKGMAGDALSGYFAIILATAAWALPAAAILAWKPTPPAALRGAWGALPAAGLAGCFLVTRLTLGGTSEFPSAFAVPAMMAVAATSAPYSGPRDANVQPPAQAPRIRKIVMIVDESIRGDYIGINDPNQPTTPFLASLGARVINFGPAVAAHNCSAAARLILRAGLTPRDLPDVKQRALKGTVIWQFARSAGFETAYVDAFVNVFGSHSYMMKPEHDFIDRALPVGGHPAYARDRRIATEVLPKLLAHDKPLFAYVNKYGAHFPYRDTYPGDFANDAGTAAGDDLTDRSLLIESYRRAVRWSVDEFFRALLAKADLKDTLILYTSDHGQSLLDGGYRLPHCSNGKVHVGEGIVPLFAIAGDGAFAERLRAGARERHGKATHFEIFPTMLLAMGYDPSWVASRYGASLLEPRPSERRRFLTGDMFGTGRGARWIDVD